MNRIFASIFVTVFFCASTAAQAQEPSARERELEDLVRKLADKVDKLESRLDQMDTGETTESTTARVEQLEQSIQKINNERPPALDSEEWIKIRKWVNDGSTLRSYWKDGLRFASNDGSVNLKIGGRIHIESATFAEDGDLERRLGTTFEDGIEFRRARLYFSATVYNDIEIKAQYDFAGGDADLKDVFIGLKNVPYLGHIRVGHFKEPFSLEQAASSNTNIFLERSLVNTFVPGRNTGFISYHNMLDKRMSFAAGVFRKTDSFGNGQGGRDYSVTARVTGLPVYEDDGRKLVHLGASYSFRNYRDNTVRFRARPGVHLAPYVADTGNIPADTGNILGVEAAWVNGPLSVQGEYVFADIQGRNRLVGDPNFWAAMIQASYFLTGEHRPYNKKSGDFRRLKPLKNFRQDGGGGAWELAAQFSYMSLNDGFVQGGRLKNLALGLNWHLNPNMRSMWQYVLSDPSNGGDVSSFMWRLQVAF